MRLIGVAFCNVSSKEVSAMAAIVKKMDRVFRCRAGWQWLASSALVLASSRVHVHACTYDQPHAQIFVGVAMLHISIYPLLIRRIQVFHELKTERLSELDQTFFDSKVLCLMDFATIYFT